MLASELIKICCRLWFLVSKYMPLIPHMKPKLPRKLLHLKAIDFFREELY